MYVNIYIYIYIYIYIHTYIYIYMCIYSEIERRNLPAWGEVRVIWLPGGLIWLPDRPDLAAWLPGRPDLAA